MSKRRGLIDGGAERFQPRGILGDVEKIVTPRRWTFSVDPRPVLHRFPAISLAGSSPAPPPLARAEEARAIEAAMNGPAVVAGLNVTPFCDVAEVEAAGRGIYGSTAEIQIEPDDWARTKRCGTSTTEQG